MELSIAKLVHLTLSAFLSFSISANASPEPIRTTPHSPTQLNDIAHSATSAVVSINVVKAGSTDQTNFLFPLSPDSSDQSRSIVIGSGVIICKEGLILTNHHVIDQAEKITVKFDEKHRAFARVIGSDPKTDLAVIEVIHPSQTYPTLSFGDSSQLQVGDWVIAIGSPFGLSRSLSQGIVSATGRAQMGILDIEDFIQTDAAINPGSSGGPLLNLKGEMIGINTAIYSQGVGFVGIGFAIPAQIASEVAQQLITHGEVRRGWVGLTVQDIDEDFAHYFRSPTSSGALISQIIPKGPAEQALLKAGDIILRYNHQPIRSAFEFKSASSKSKIGSTALIEISRNGQLQSYSIKIGEQPELFGTKNSRRTQRAGMLSTPPRSIGLSIEEIPDEIAKILNIAKNTGVLISGVEPGSLASEAGLSAGDIILQANQIPVHTTHEFVKLARKLVSQEISMLYIQRGPDERLFVPLRGGHS